MRPKIRFLNDDLILKIISEAKEILCTLGIEIHNNSILSLLSDSGAKIDIDKSHVVFTEDIINKSLETAPTSFNLFDVHGKHTIFIWSTTSARRENADEEITDTPVIPSGRIDISDGLLRYCYIPWRFYPRSVDH